MNYVTMIGFLAAGLVIATLSMRTMIPLRVIGLASNVAFVTYGALFGSIPTVILHGILFPLNVYRLHEMLKLVKQVEAASSLGLSRNRSMRLVILPQAMRVIIPPMTNQYLNLTKNSSLAVAIGYPDVVSISNTAINQTGRAVECIAIIMAVYLTTSLTTSAIMGWYNKRAAIKER